jgi:hypothetical protein
MPLQPGGKVVEETVEAGAPEAAQWPAKAGGKGFHLRGFFQLGSADKHCKVLAEHKVAKKGHTASTTSFSRNDV